MTSKKNRHSWNKSIYKWKTEPKNVFDFKISQIALGLKKNTYNIPRLESRLP